MSNDEKVDYGALIEKLGGEVKDAQYFDPSCTHIVVGKLEACISNLTLSNDPFYLKQNLIVPAILFSRPT